MRGHAGVRAAEVSLENAESRMPRVCARLKAKAALSRWREGEASGGVFASSAYEEDGLVTREALTSPAKYPGAAETG